MSTFMTRMRSLLVCSMLALLALTTSRAGKLARLCARTLREMRTTGTAFSTQLRSPAIGKSVVSEKTLPIAELSVAAG